MSNIRSIPFQQHIEEISKRERIIGDLNRQLKERNDAVLIFKIRSRIGELERKFLYGRAAQLSRSDKWRIILTDTSSLYINNIELIQFRNTVSQIPQDLFINTVCLLYPKKSNAFAHQFPFHVQYDDDSIRMALIDAGMPPDDSRVCVVSSLLSPIRLPQFSRD